MRLDEAVGEQVQPQVGLLDAGRGRREVRDHGGVGLQADAAPGVAASRGSGKYASSTRPEASETVARPRPQALVVGSLIASADYPASAASSSWLSSPR